MVFSSHLFIFWFLPVALLVYYVLKGRWRHVWLTLISYAFYGWTNPLFVLLLLFSTVVDYVCGLVLMGYPNDVPSGGVQLVRGAPRSNKQKAALVVSVVTNLSLLGFFKYANFGLENWNALMQALNAPDMLLPALNIVLPLGISFYTFQSLSYTIDVYRGDARGITSFVDFACFVSMFPQLVAGPIIRFQEVADQLRSRTHTVEKFARGVAFFVLGMAQKILLANPNGKMADWAFDTANRGVMEAWSGITAYSFQIFFDFAGYSNMAIGLGLMLGFVFPKNFDDPYRSLSITEFWRRWHISLSTWLRDYLYIPLGGNRKGAARTYINLMLVMLLGGFWHGASWNFVIWGAIHGTVLVVERYFGVAKHAPRFRILYWAYTYLIVLFAWVFFRASDLSGAWAYVKSLVGLSADGINSSLVDAALFSPYNMLCWIMAALAVAFAPSAWEWTRNITRMKALVLAVLFMLSLVALTAQSYNPFIYFIF